MSSYRVAVTGGAATGKSTVCGYIQDLGFEVLSLDDVGHEVLEQAQTRTKISEALGLGEDWTRDDLRSAVLKSSGARRQLNAITHPIILKRMNESSVHFVEVPLLVETCIQHYFQEIWLVDCGKVEQLRRLTVRLNSVAKARQFVASQLPIESKYFFADLIVRTNEPESNVQRYVSERIESIRDLIL